MWEYRDISLDNISYRGYSWISKYRISIFIVFMFVKDEVYSLDMNSYETKISDNHKIVRYSYVISHLYHTM